MMFGFLKFLKRKSRNFLYDEVKSNPTVFNGVRLEFSDLIEGWQHDNLRDLTKRIGRVIDWEKRNGSLKTEELSLIGKLVNSERQRYEVSDVGFERDMLNGSAIDER